MDNAVRFEKTHTSQRIKSMLKVDFRRMFKSRLFYILIACSLLIPIVMTVMLCMMDGQVSVDPQTGKETVKKTPLFFTVSLPVDIIIAKHRKGSTGKFQLLFELPMSNFRNYLATEKEEEYE